MDRTRQRRSDHPFCGYRRLTALWRLELSSPCYGWRSGGPFA